MDVKCLHPSRGRRSSALLATFVGLAVGSVGCSRVVAPIPATPAPPGAEWLEEGVASWYGIPFHGRLTASGEVYDMEAMTAAHRTLAFGTVLGVLNLENGRETTVRVNDRGPFIRGRHLDLSRRAARELEMIGPGTARVRLTILGTPPVRESCWIVQAGAFSDRENAEFELRALERRGHEARISTAPSGLHRVRVGPFSSLEEAEAVGERNGGVLLGCGVSDT